MIMRFILGCAFLLAWSTVPALAIAQDRASNIIDTKPNSKANPPDSRIPGIVLKLQTDTRLRNALNKVPKSAEINQSVPDTKTEIENIFQNNGISLSSISVIPPELGAATPIAQTWVATDVWKVWCDADWNERCEGREYYKPEDGWDICEYKFTEESKSHGEWHVIDASSTRVGVYLRSAGSHFPFDRWGGWVRVRLSYVKFITAGATKEQRDLAKCKLTNAGGGGQGGTDLWCIADWRDLGGHMGVQICAEWIIEDGKKKYTSTLPCGVCYRE
jgi:hypothetical protein